MSGELDRSRPNLDQLFDSWEAAWSGADGSTTRTATEASFAAICTTDVQYEDPTTAEPLYGPAALAQHAGRLRMGFPNVHVEPLGPRLGDGRMAAAPVRISGVHRGPLGPIPASERPLKLPVVFYCELRGTRIHRARAFFDLYDAAVQLGVLPGRGSLGEKAMMVARGFGWRRS